MRFIPTIIDGLILTLELKDIYTHGHSLQVAHFSHLTALELGMPPREAENLYHGGLLHDIGKIGLADHLLSNLGNLSAEEFQAVKRHPLIGKRILERFSILEEVIPVVLYHHERFDGSGYPEGKSVDAVPWGARILAVCDTFDAMISQRPNKPMMAIDEAVIHLRSNSGILYDPRVLDAFQTALHKQPAIFTPYVKDADHAGDEDRSSERPRASKAPRPQVEESTGAPLECVCVCTETLPSM